MSETENGFPSKYVIKRKLDGVVVADAITSRKDARDMKRKLESDHVNANGGRRMPSAFQVYTGPDNPQGNDIYIH